MGGGGGSRVWSGVRHLRSKGSGQSKRLWDPMGMMTVNVQKHLSVNTMSVGNLSFLSYLGGTSGRK